jgi:hypothetical protein
MLKKDIKPFKAELKALLLKHGASIGVLADDCSDWHGITGERLSVCDINSGKEIHSLTDSCLDIYPSDL